MNYLLFVFKSAIFDFSRNKGRTLLTSLGILIGVLSVVLLIAFGLGLKKSIQGQFEGLGANNIFVFPGQVLTSSGGFRGTAGVSSTTFKEKDWQAIQKADYVLAAAPISVVSTNASAYGKTEAATIFATSVEYFDVLNTKTDFGEIFSKADTEKRAKVAVIGSSLAEKLFEDKESAIGQSIKANNTSYKIIGIAEKKASGGFGGPDIDSYIYIPYTTGFLFNANKDFSRIVFKATSDDVIPLAKDNVSKIMLKNYKEDEFSLVEQTQILNAVTSIFAALNSVLIAIAAISLIVGGIGIMNIMYVTVSERTREIGIRRAIGGRKIDILSQFIIESVLLSFLGGLLGVILSYIIVFFIQPYFPAYISFESVLLAFGVSSVTGIVFGVFPAKKAADLSPMEAIRYE